jgi:hypothetical protein
MKMMPPNTWKENRTQAEAIRRIKGNVLDTIELYAADFRQIIDDFKGTYHGLPTANDLIWITSERYGRDITQR